MTDFPSMYEPVAFPCGHVQLVKGQKMTTVEFHEAVNYARRLVEILNQEMKKAGVSDEMLIAAG
jgi:hypothetical protein